MFEKIGTGLAMTMMAVVLPNALAISRPSLPVGLAQHAMMPTASPAISTTPAAPATPVRPEVMTPINSGALFLGHQVVYLHRVSAYNAVSWQTNGDPGMSACGPTRPHQIALSQDLFFRKNGSNRCGEHVEIALGDGQVIHGVVWDTMNPRYHMAADVLMASVQQAIDFGVHHAELRAIVPSQPQSIGS